MSCFSCGKDFSSDTNALLRAYKLEFQTYGKKRYFYKTETNGSIMICSESSFKFIYDNYIKPNLRNGAEYGSISEYP